MEIPSEFFTLESILTLSGAATATYVISNSIQYAFNFNPKWLALVLAQLIALFGVYQSNGSGSDYLIGVINGFLIYATTVGVATLVSGNNTSPQTSRESPATAAAPGLDDQKKRTFFTPWF